MSSVAARRIRLAIIIVVGIGLGVLLGRLVLPPGGPDPAIEPRPSAVSVSLISITP